MNAILDSKGNEIKVGALIKSQGSSIIRVAAGSVELVSSNGEIMAHRLDGKGSKNPWVKPECVEVVG